LSADRADRVGRGHIDSFGRWLQLRAAVSRDEFGVGQTSRRDPSHDRTGRRRPHNEFRYGRRRRPDDSSSGLGDAQNQLIRKTSPMSSNYRAQAGLAVHGPGPWRNRGPLTPAPSVRRWWARILDAVFVLFFTGIFIGIALTLSAV